MPWPSSQMAAEAERPTETAVGGTAATLRTSDVTAGERHAGEAVGRYVVLERVGAGAMGAVYAAYDPALDRRVALKLLHFEPRARRRERRRERLLQEAKALARLRHPNIVTVYDVGVMNEEVFIAMEYVQGPTLRDWLKSAQRSWRAVVATFVAAGRGLAAAHAAGVIHRDFKPDNVLVDEDGRARVVDFSISESVDPSEQSQNSEDGPSGGSIAGTPRYMAPEQHLGQLAHARADQYCFCVALYEALHEVRPFGDVVSELLERKQARQLEPSPRDRELPPWLREVLLRGLEPSPARRWPNMDALLAMLSRDPQALRRRRALGVGAAVLLLGAGSAATLAVVEESGPSCQAPRDALQALWNTERSAALEQAFRATGAAFADAAWQRVGERLEAWQEAWRSEYTQACRATHVLGEQSPQLLDLRMACLRQRKDELDATLSSAFAPAAIDAELVSHADEVLDTLESPQSCARTALHKELPVAAAEVLVPLERADALRAAARLEPALEAARQAQQAADEIGDPRLEALAHFTIGRILADGSHRDAARGELLEAFFVARGAGVAGTAARAAISLIKLVAVDEAAFDDAALWSRHAAVEIAAAGEPVLQVRHLLGRAYLADLRSEYTEALSLYQQALEVLDRQPIWDESLRIGALTGIGNMHQAMGHVEEALHYQEQARQQLEDEVGADHPRMGAIYNNIGNAQSSLGRYQAALASYERALQIWRNTYGDEHPRVSAVLHNLGSVRKEMGDWEAARDYYRREGEIALASFGPTHPVMIDYHLSIGETFLQQGQLSKAREHYELAHKLALETLGTEHFTTGVTWDNLGILARREGRLRESRQAHEKALDILRNVVGADSPILAHPYLGLARVALEQNSPAAALTHTRATLALDEHGGLEPAMRTEALILAARALQSSGGDRDEAQRLAHRANQEASKLIGYAELRREVARWLAAHPR